MLLRIYSRSRNGVLRGHICTKFEFNKNKPSKFDVYGTKLTKHQGFYLARSKLQYRPLCSK